MLITVDPDHELAIYDQIMRQMKFAIAGGAVLPGELVPSVRELATRVAVNPNTVARAYRELQGEGILETVRGTGLAVTIGAAKLCREHRQRLIRERLRSVLLEAQQSQLSPDDIRQLLDSEFARLPSAKGKK